MNNYLEEISIMNKLFKGTTQDYLRLRAKKHRNVYNNEEGALILEKMADNIDDANRKTDELVELIKVYEKSHK